MVQNSILCFCVNRNQPHVVELSRRLEQHSSAVLLASFRRSGRPCSVTGRSVELAAVRRLVLQPPAYFLCKLQFRKRTAEQPIFECLRVNGFNFFRPDLVQGTPLHELALHRVERRELIVFFRERTRFRFDAEKLRQEILDVRSKCHQQIRLFLCSQLFRRVTRRKEALMQCPVRFAEKAQKRLIEAHQSLTLIEIVEPDAEAEFHESKIIIEIPLHAQRITLFQGGHSDADQEQRLPCHRRCFRPRRCHRAHGGRERRQGRDRGHASRCRREIRERNAQKRSVRASSRPTSLRKPTARRQSSARSRNSAAFTCW